MVIFSQLTHEPKEDDYYFFLFCYNYVFLSLLIIVNVYYLKEIRLLCFRFPESWNIFCSTHRVNIERASFRNNICMQEAKSVIYVKGFSSHFLDVKAYFCSTNRVNIERESFRNNIYIQEAKRVRYKDFPQILSKWKYSFVLPIE